MALTEAPGYELELRRGADRTRLIVLLSTSSRFAMYRRTFRQDVLFVADSRMVYYAEGSEALAQAVAATIDLGAYARVLFVGGSKAGFGALLIGGLCARLRPNRIIRILAFQPRARIWPYDPSRPIPSYHRLHARAARSRHWARSLRRNGDVSFVGELPNVAARIVYAEKNEVDRRQAQLVRGPNVSYLPIPTTLHNTIAFVDLAKEPEARIRSELARIYLKEEGDRTDVKPDFDVVAREILSSGHLPSLAGMFDQAFALEPAPIGLAWRAAALARRGVRTLWGRAFGARPARRGRHWPGPERDDEGPIG